LWQLCLLLPALVYLIVASVPERGTLIVSLGVLAAGHLVAFIVPSPKLADLLRDGRYALHSSGAEDVNDEFCLMGRAERVRDRDLQAASLAACRFIPGEDHVLVELDMQRALWAHYSSPPSWPPTYRRWSSG